MFSVCFGTDKKNMHKGIFMFYVFLFVCCAFQTLNNVNLTHVLRSECTTWIKIKKNVLDLRRKT